MHVSLSPFFYAPVGCLVRFPGMCFHVSPQQHSLCTNAALNIHRLPHPSVHPAPAHLHNISTVLLGIVDLEGDEVFSFDAGAVTVINAHAFSLKAQLEELALGDGHFHLRRFAGHLCINDVVRA